MVTPCTSEASEQRHLRRQLELGSGSLFFTILWFVVGPHYHNREFGNQGRNRAERSQHRGQDRADRSQRDGNLNERVAMFIPNDDPTHVAFTDKGSDFIHEIPSENLHFLDKVL
jgi:hypothetical protein